MKEGQGNMDTQAALSNALQWQDSYSNKITKGAWKKLTTEIERLVARAEEVHRARCATGNLALQDVYNDLLDKIGDKMVVARLVAPDAIGNLAEAIGKEVNITGEMHIRLMGLWWAIDIGEK